MEENLGTTLLCTSMCELSQGLNIGVENKGLQLSAFRSHPEELQLWILESLQPWFEWHGKRVALTTIGTQDCEISSVSQLQHSWSRRMDFAWGFKTSSSMHPVSCSVPTCYMFKQMRKEIGPEPGRIMQKDGCSMLGVVYSLPNQTGFDSELSGH